MSTEPSVFSGDLGEDIKAVFADTGMEVLSIEKRKGIFGWKALQFALQTKKNKV